MSIHYDYIEEILPHDIFFVTTSELAEMFPDYSPNCLLYTSRCV